MAPLDPMVATLRARLAAHARWARTEDRSAATEPARAAADRALAQRNGIAPDSPDYEARMRNARSEQMTRLALKSVQARRSAGSVP